MAKLKSYSITEAFNKVSYLDHGKLFLKDVKVDHDDSEDFVLGQSVSTAKEVYFDHVTFGKFRNEFVSIGDRQVLYFVNCTFNEPVNFHGGIFHFTECTFKSGIEFNDTDLISFEYCDFKKHAVHVDRATTVIVDHCKNLDYLYADRVSADIGIQYSPVTEIIVEDCNLDSMTIDHSSVNDVKCSLSVIRNLDFWGVNKQTIKKVSLCNTLIDTALSIDGPKVECLDVKKSMLTGNFLYNVNTAPEIDSEKSVGFVPPENEIYLYKKCIIPGVMNNKYTPVIVKLQVPETAERVYCDELKLRVSEAKVIEFYDLDGKVYKPRMDKYVCSSWDRKFKYNIGETVKPTNEFDPTSGECGSGIHGFTSFADAKAYML